MGANNSHLPLHRSRGSSQSQTSTPRTTFTSDSTPSTAHGSPETTYTAPSPTISFSGPSDERTSISCEPSTSPLTSRANVPLRIGYPYYEEVTLEAKRGGSRRRSRSRSLSKVLDHIGLSGSSNH